MKEKIDFKHPELTNIVEDCFKNSLTCDKKDHWLLICDSNLKRTIHKYSKDYYNLGFLKKLIDDLLKYINEFIDRDPKKVDEIMRTEVSDIIKIVKENRRINNRENKFKRLCSNE